MIVFDTDHLTVVQNGIGPRYDRLVARLAAAGQRPGTTIVSAEEQMKGWLAAINKERAVTRQVSAYRELGDLFGFFARYLVAPFDEAAATTFDQYRAAKVRIGTSDLKIAAIAVRNGALLLSANLRHFRQVPGLRVENWLD